MYFRTQLIALDDLLYSDEAVEVMNLTIRHPCHHIFMYYGSQIHYV